jgi:CarD family transcriptional regulator, regulator of rRNA transcription
MGPASARKGKVMRFQVGETIVHPDFGAGVIAEVKELRSLGEERRRYYAIELLSQPGTVVMVALRNADQVGLRLPIPQSGLSQVWYVLRSEPRVLPSDHNERYTLIKGKLRGGDILQVAEALRDMLWRKEQKRNLTPEGKRLCDYAMSLLSGEVATAQGCDLVGAKIQIMQAMSYQTAS